MSDISGIEKMASLFAELFKDHWKVMTSDWQYFENALQAYAFLADIYNHKLVSPETLDLLNEALDDLYGYARRWDESNPPKIDVEGYEFTLNALKANFVVTSNAQIGTVVSVFDETVFTAPFVTPPRRHNFTADHSERERASLLAKDYALCEVYGEQIKVIMPISAEYMNDPNFGIF